MKGKLYLIPSPLADEASISFIPEFVKKTVAGLRIFIVEEERTSRRFLRKMDPAFPIDGCTFNIFNEHTSRTELDKYLEPISHNDIGLMSEAGLPCVADPGYEIVQTAHKLGIQVIPLPGMSSIFMALMASGLNGQKFAFHGYLPVKKEEKIKCLKQLINQSSTEKQTQIMMEAPYRNNPFLDDLLEILPAKTLLCVAADITSPGEFIKTMPVSEWKKQKPDLNKRPAIFLFQCQ
jgi:16S rRNA (cytidine1402-2'-O)-methyltransferase